MQLENSSDRTYPCFGGKIFLYSDVGTIIMMITYLLLPGHYYQYYHWENRFC